MRFYIHKLGCAKNEVDGEGMERVLAAAGHEPVADPHEADALIVNTCAFIGKAREQSIAELKRLATLKRRTSRVRRGMASAGKLLIAAGCLSQRSPEELRRAVPELDGLLGTLRWAEIGALLDEAAAGARPSWVGDPQGTGTRAIPRLASSPSAYLKIADGCDAACSFCAIPAIKGPQRSKPLVNVMAEARALADQGVLEIVLIAQDTTAYGADRGEQDGLATLLERLVDVVPDVPWLRLMYAYPAHISDRLVEVIAAHPQVVKYLDLPLQHGHPDVLKRMLRPQNGRHVVARLRQAVPDIALRSAFIVGFPGETEAQFHGLLEFMEEMRFDRVGVFEYSREQGTQAAALGPAVPPKAVRSRYARAMALQQRISLERNRALVGQVIDVLVESNGDAIAAAKATGGEYGAVGRSYRDAPEVDGFVLIREKLPAGTMAKVRIAAALPYDLVGGLAVHHPV